MLNFDPAWRFQSPGKIASGVVPDLTVLIKRVAGQYGNRQPVIEHYKRYFADAAGRPSYQSSSLSWSESDLDDYMQEAAENAPMFIEAFFDAGQALINQNPALVVPDVATINRILINHDAGYELKPPLLIARTRAFRTSQRAGRSRSAPRTNSSNKGGATSDDRNAVSRGLSQTSRLSKTAAGG